MGEAEDHQAALARFAQQWVRANQAHHAWKTWKPTCGLGDGAAIRTATESNASAEPGLYPEPNELGRSSTSRSPGQDFGRFEAARRWARVVFPGAVGELIEREISAYLNFGFYLDGGGLVAQLVEQVLATELAELRAEQG